MNTSTIVSIQHLSKRYPDGFQALKDINLDIRQGEIFALLGPNGAGKTTLISAICGIVQPSEGQILVDGHDVVREASQARRKIGLVPQELATDSFESVLATVNFSRGLFGKAANPALIEDILKQLSLWDKRNNRIMELSGGMKRRLLIAKALCHEPSILFLDEPTAGVDVELRKDMWKLVRKLREQGCTIILTTHYIEEAEDMADRIGVINHGEIILVEDKHSLMKQLGKRQLDIHLHSAVDELPTCFSHLDLSIINKGHTLRYQFDSKNDDSGIADLLRQLGEQGIQFSDLHSSQSSLEDIFVSLVEDKS